MSKETTILAVDDEPDILGLLRYNLVKAGFNVIVAVDGPEAIKVARGSLPDLILLDIMLPNMEGTEVLKVLKSDDVTAKIPVIMLTAKGEEVDRIVGFELGSEDYITKPFSPRELILRVKAVLKRLGGAGTREVTGEVSGSGADEGGGEETLSYRGISIDLSAHKVKAGGVEIELTATEFRLLQELIGSKGKVLSRDRLLDRVWGTECFVTPRTVDTHVRRLRGKLGPEGGAIETVRGVGYRLSEEDG